LANDETGGFDGTGPGSTGFGNARVVDFADVIHGGLPDARVCAAGCGDDGDDVEVLAFADGTGAAADAAGVADGELLPRVR
jgi:hypothetical protein